MSTCTLAALCAYLFAVEFFGPANFGMLALPFEWQSLHIVLIFVYNIQLGAHSERGDTNGNYVCFMMELFGCWSQQICR